ncbi:MAG: hypothetical protein FWE77_00040 [Clostridia bacterium]|nr:hypothetical protein [Clostridia bacterium]
MDFKQKMCSFSQNKAVRIVFFSALMLAFALYSYGLFARQPIDSDYASLVLEANDILGGNLLLSGWTLTGISFIASDMPFFVLGSAFFGISIESYLAAVTSMFVAMCLAAMLLLRAPNGTQKRRLRLLDLCIFMALALPFSPVAVNLLRAHTGVIVYVFVCAFCVERILRSTEKNTCEKNTRYCVLYALCMALGSMSDSIMLLLGAGAALAVLAFRLMCSHDVDKKKYVMLIALTAAGAAAGLLADRLFFLIGGAHKNSFISKSRFIAMDQLGQKAYIYLQVVLGMLGADFSDQPIRMLDALWYAMRGLVFVFALGIMIGHIARLFRGKGVDEAGAMLSVGFLLISAVFILTDMGGDVDSGRYIAYAPALFAILIVRYCRSSRLLERALFYGKAPLKAVAAALCVLFVISGYVPVSLTGRAVAGQERLGAFLQEQGLECGYGQFWNAAHTTVATNDRVRVRAIFCDEYGPVSFNWFIKEGWYDQPANFVISDNRRFNFGMYEHVVAEAFGEPARRLTFEDFVIYVYDRDLSKELL